VGALVWFGFTTGEPTTPPRINEPMTLMPAVCQPFQKSRTHIVCQILGHCWVLLHFSEL
jgi:hypothetical protein